MTERQLPPLDACIALWAAVLRQWARDARHNPAALASLARWLRMEPDTLRQRLDAGYQPRPRRKNERIAP